MYLVIPFESVSTSSVFAKAINITFTELIKFVSVYFNDVTIYSTDFNNHLKHLK